MISWVCKDDYKLATIWVLNDELGLFTVYVLSDGEVLILGCCHWMVSDDLRRVICGDFESNSRVNSALTLFNALLDIVLFTLG